MISVVIPSLGGDLCNTLDSVNAGSICPDEIIACLPNDTHSVKDAFKYKNLTIVYAKRYGLITGLSDHTIDNITAITSIALEASIIEKHVTLDRNGGGPDDSFSLEYGDLRELCVGVKTAWEALGRVDYSQKSSEQGNIKFRRSLYFIKDIKQGEVITKKHVKSIRPGFGLMPKYLDKVLGLKASHDVKRGTPVALNLIE